MSARTGLWRLLVLPAGVVAAACSSGDDGADGCGPRSAVVLRAIDGDTIELEGGERVRYLLVDAPESTSTLDCYGPEAAQYNADLVEGQTVTLAYDVECRDLYDRLLAYVSVGDREVNRLLVERGYACVLYIPPNGADRRDEFLDLEAQARADGRGMWSACEEVTCQ